MNIALEKITLEGMNELDRDFQRDPATFADMSLCSAYRYSPETTRKRFERYCAPDRRHFLIMLDGRPVGETGIKHIDWEKREGELSIHLQNDAVKNRGIGTAAERLLLTYAFDELGLTAVTARVIEKNTRSRRVLEKVGFVFVRQENGFLHYRFLRERFLKTFPGREKTEAAMRTLPFAQYIQEKQRFSVWEISSKDALSGVLPDALNLYHTAELGISNIGSLMPYGNANDIVKKMSAALPVRELGRPVFAGVCGTDPFCMMEPLLEELAQNGVYGVQNFPTIGLAGSKFRYNVEAISLGFRREVDMMKTARRVGLETLPFIFNQFEALAMAEAEPAAMVCHLGILQRFGENGAAMSIEPYLDRLQSIRELLRKENPNIRLYVYARAKKLADIIEAKRDAGLDIDGIYTTCRPPKMEAES